MFRIDTIEDTAAVAEEELTLDYHPVAIKIFNDDDTDDIEISGGTNIVVKAGEVTGWLECSPSKTVTISASANTPAYRIMYKSV